MTGFIFGIFIFILIFSPLAFGTVETWSLAVMETLSFFALFLLLWKNPKPKESSFYAVPGIIPLLLLITYMLIQLIPLPPELLRLISPETYSLYRETVYIDKPLKWIPITINERASLAEFFRIASYGAFYIVTVQLLSEKDLFKKTVAGIIIFASLLSVFSILQHFLSNNEIFWFRKLRQGSSPFGPYINRDHYAGLMEMLFPLVLSLFLFYKPHIPHKSFREKISGMFNVQKTNIHILLGFSAILVATSIFLTLSRTGIVSLCISMIFFGAMFFVKEKNRKRSIIIIVLFVLIFISVGWFGWDPIFERFEKIRGAQGDIMDLRPKIWSDIRNIIRDFPLFGVGFGNLLAIYPRYRTAPGEELLEHAHNDYMELLSNGGIIAFFLCAIFLLSLFLRSYKTFLKRREMYSLYLFIASAAGIISMLIHAFGDFNLQVGANGLYFFFLLGLVVSASHTRLREGLNKTYLKKVRIPLRLMRISSAVLFAATLVFTAGFFAADAFFSPVKDLNLNSESSHNNLIAIRDRAYGASLLDPLEARYAYAIANTEKLLGNNETALNYYRKSVRLNPANGEYLQRLGLILSEFRQYDAADKLLQSGIKYDMSNPLRYKRYAIWLLSFGKKEDSRNILKAAISLEPQKTGEYITLMVLNGLSDGEIAGFLPERVEPHLLFADYLFKTGRNKGAEDEYLTALSYIGNEKRIKPVFFYKIYRYYMKEGRYEDALHIMQKAVQYIPDDARIRMNTAALYEKLGMMHKAIEEYGKTLDIEPENQEAKRKLDNLLLKSKG